MAQVVDLVKSQLIAAGVQLSRRQLFCPNDLPVVWATCSLAHESLCAQCERARARLATSDRLSNEQLNWNIRSSANYSSPAAGQNQLNLLNLYLRLAAACSTGSSIADRPTLIGRPKLPTDTDRLADKGQKSSRCGRRAHLASCGRDLWSPRD